MQGKVLLVQPPLSILHNAKLRCPVPLGIGYVAAYLREFGYEVGILDCVIEGIGKRRKISEEVDIVGLSNEEIGSTIASRRPQYVGVSCLMSSQFANMLAVCRIAKEINPDIVTFTGGAHPSALPDDVLGHGEVDAVVVGEGERGALRVLEGARGRVASEVMDVDEIPWPARDLLSVGRYVELNAPMNLFTKYNRVTQMVTSRGCPFRCSFCATTRFHGKWRGRDADDVVRELKFLYDEYGVQEVNIVEENFIFDRERALRILRGAPGTGIKALSAPGGIWVQGLDEELLVAMREAGFYQVTFPIESSDKDILKRVIRKPLDLAKVPGLVRFARKLGMDTHGFFIFGFPEQDEGHLRKDMRYARSLGFDSVSVSVLSPYPGSPYFQEYRDRIDMGRLWSTTANVPHPIYSGKEIEDLAKGYSEKYNKALFWRRPLRFVDKYFGTMLRRLRLRDWDTLFSKH
jgi:radical SAM superfamily enzyme YgiQ (UPF0313 family)